MIIKKKITDYIIHPATMHNKIEIKKLWFKCRSNYYTAQEAEQDQNLDQYISQIL